MFHDLEFPRAKTHNKGSAPEARLRAAPLACSCEWTLTLARERRMFAVRLWNVVQVLLSIVLAVARRKAAQLCAGAVNDSACRMVNVLCCLGGCERCAIAV